MVRFFCSHKRPKCPERCEQRKFSINIKRKPIVFWNRTVERCPELKAISDFGDFYSPIISRQTVFFFFCVHLLALLYCISMQTHWCSFHWAAQTRTNKLYLSSGCYWCCMPLEYLSQRLDQRSRCNKFFYAFRFSFRAYNHFHVFLHVVFVHLWFSKGFSFYVRAPFFRYRSSYIYF